MTAGSLIFALLTVAAVLFVVAVLLRLPEAALLLIPVITLGGGLMALTLGAILQSPAMALAGLGLLVAHDAVLRHGTANPTR